MDSIKKEDELVRNSPNENEACLRAVELCSRQVFAAVLNGAIEIKLFDMIAKEENTNGAFMSVSEIASKMPIQHTELRNRLHRMIRLLASHSLLTCSTRANVDGSTETVYGVSPIGKYFVSDQSVGYLGSFSSYLCSPAMSQVWPNFKDVIADEKDLFTKVHGMSTYQYMDIDPTLNHIFNKAMSDFSTLAITSILQTYKRFEGISKLVDVGGGTGKTLQMIISKYPSIKGINFDLPNVVEEAPNYPNIEHVGGDMFTSVPQGADAIIVKSTLHNWSDEKCIRILRNCHRALPQNGKVIVVDFIVLEESNSDISKVVSIVDNLMLVTTAGKERTVKEFEALSKLSGFSGFELVCYTFTAYGIMEFHK